MGCNKALKSPGMLGMSRIKLYNKTKMNEET